MDKIELNKCQKDKIAEICAEFGNAPGELINVLHKCQGHFGYLPEEVQREIARNLHIPVAKVYGVVTFYSFFTMQPKGRHSISVCMGTACYVRGAESVLEELVLPGVPALRGRLRSGTRDAGGRESLRPSGTQADQGYPRPVRIAFCAKRANCCVVFGMKGGTVSAARPFYFGNLLYLCRSIEISI